MYDGFSDIDDLMYIWISINEVQSTINRPEDLQRAIEDVRSGMGTLREIAERYGVPHSTLSVNARMAGISVQQRNLDYDNETLEAAKQAVKGNIHFYLFFHMKNLY